jgi:hypothetical protein
MASATTKTLASAERSRLTERLAPMNFPPASSDAARELPEGFLEFLAPLHEAVTPRQEMLLAPLPVDANGEAKKLREARRIGEEMILRGEFTPA